jgi:hypothetical protein
MMPMLPTLIVVACLDPAQFGAVPDDGKSDTAAIQAAIDEAADKQQPVCLGKGVFELERTREFGSLRITKGPLEIYGVGPETILRMSGAGNRADWRGIDIKGARAVSMHDLTIDGLGAYDTHEQTHLVFINPGTHDVTFDHVMFGPMRTNGQKVGEGIGGDCLRLLGQRGNEATDITVVHSTFHNCDRSGISLQRGLRRVLIAHDTVEGTGDQEIDFEPTGKGTIEDVFMVDLIVKRDPQAQGAAAIAIGGHKEQLTRHVVLSDSTITGGGLFLLDVADVQLLRNKIDFGAQNTNPTINIMRRASEIRISNNEIVRPVTAAAGPVLAAQHLSKQMPRGITFEHNTIVQETSSPVVRMMSTNDIAVIDNKIDYRGQDPTVAIVDVTAVIGDVRGVAVSNNQIVGNARAVLWLRNREHHIRSVDLRGNHADHVATSTHCQGAADGFEDLSSDAPEGQTTDCRGVQIRDVRAPLPAATKTVDPAHAATPKLQE